jgi:hypothetical protein
VALLEGGSALRVVCTLVSSARRPHPRRPNEDDDVALFRSRFCRVIDLSVGAGRAAVLRVWSQLPEGAQAVLEDELSPTDLQTLLLDLAKTRADRLEPPSVRQRWERDRLCGLHR